MKASPGEREIKKVSTTTNKNTRLSVHGELSSKFTLHDSMLDYKRFEEEKTADEQNALC